MISPLTNLHSIGYFVRLFNSAQHIEFTIYRWVYAKDYEVLVSDDNSEDGCSNPEFSSLPLHRSYIPESTREGKLVEDLKGTLVETYNEKSTVSEYMSRWMRFLIVFSN